MFGNVFKYPKFKRSFLGILCNQHHYHSCSVREHFTCSVWPRSMSMSTASASNEAHPEGSMKELTSTVDPCNKMEYCK